MRKYFFVGTPYFGTRRTFFYFSKLQVVSPDALLFSEASRIQLETRGTADSHP